MVSSGPRALPGGPPPVSSHELRATEKVMTCTMLRVGLLIKAASLGIGPRCVSARALQSSNTQETSSTSFSRERIN